MERPVPKEFGGFLFMCRKLKFWFDLKYSIKKILQQEILWNFILGGYS